MKYLKMIKNVISLDFMDIIWTALLTFAGTAFGLLISGIIYALNHDTGYVPMASVFATIMAGILLVFGKIFTVTSGFTLAVSMNRSRKEYIVGKYISLIIEVGVALGVVELSSFIDNLLCKLLPTEDISQSLVNIPVLLLIGLIFLVPLFIMLLGILYVKFDRKFLWAVWGVWMIVNVGIPRIATTMETRPDSFVAKVGQFFVDAFSFDTVATGIVCAVLVVICFFINIALYRKTEIKA